MSKEPLEVLLLPRTGGDQVVVVHSGVGVVRKGYSRLGRSFGYTSTFVGGFFALFLSFSCLFRTFLNHFFDLKLRRLEMYCSLLSSRSGNFFIISSFPYPRWCFSTKFFISSDTFSMGLEVTFFPETRYIAVHQRGFGKTSSFGLSR